MLHIARAAHDAENGKERPIRHSEKIPFRFVPVPANFFEWTPLLSSAEIKVYLCVIDKTWRFRKSSDQISCSQFTAHTGFSKSQVLRAVARLEEIGLLRVTRHHRQLSSYEALNAPLCPVKTTIP